MVQQNYEQTQAFASSGGERSLHRLSKKMCSVGALLLIFT